MSIINLVFAQMLILDLVLICLSLYYEDSTFDASNKGIFGFIQVPFVSFFLNGFMSGFWGICGYVIACKYYPPVVMMNCLLLEPIVGQTIGVYLHIDKPPGVMTYVGGMLIMAAINIQCAGSEETK